MVGSPESFEVKLKLYIIKRTNKVLTAEADKQALDYLSLVLSHPIGAAISLIEGDRRLYTGSLSNLYGSVNKLDDSYLLSSLNKRVILNHHKVLRLLPTDMPKKFYKCVLHNYVCGDPTVNCPTCGSPFRTTELSCIAGSGTKFGSYIIMDNLEVKPLSIISVARMLREFVLTADDLEERECDLGVAEAYRLMKASFESNNVLSTALL
ncbi:hypothetical protein OSB04_026560 [Centaurea solstitialis]|uniref:Uncharacterized protein n=1 Tax=Centaurea solstitialis TaxID=347529 RepID=A0AA38SDG3_9ASTR|nr:hypothetical protein OSB04_026560 [Centaurea solstitialis]